MVCVEDVDGLDLGPNVIREKLICQRLNVLIEEGRMIVIKGEGMVGDDGGGGGGD